MQTRAAEVAERVSEFLHRSVVGSPGAARLLAADPTMATYDIRTAAVLGDVATARRLIAADPDVAVRPDELVRVATSAVRVHVTVASARAARS